MTESKNKGCAPDPAVEDFEQACKRLESEGYNRGDLHDAHDLHRWAREMLEESERRARVARDVLDWAEQNI